MANRIMIDTNVLLDYLLEREPFFEDAKKVILSCIDGKAKGCIAAHSIPNMFFILRKDYSAKERREVLLNLCKIFDIEGIAVLSQVYHKFHRSLLLYAFPDYLGNLGDFLD